MEANQAARLRDSRFALAEPGGVPHRPTRASPEDPLVVDDRGCVLPGMDGRVPCVLGAGWIWSARVGLRSGHDGRDPSIDSRPILSRPRKLRSNGVLSWIPPATVDARR